MDNIKRALQPEIEKRLRPGKVMLILGARRVGKTVLVKQIAGGFNGRKMILNGESMDTMRILGDRTAANYRNLFGDLELLAIDEAQHIPQIGLNLKFLVDEVPGVRVIATGSSSFDLKNTSGEPLVGRSAQFSLAPFSIEELSEEKTRSEVFLNLDELIVYGHYPELFNLTSASDRREYLEDVVDSYLLRDILAVDGVKNSQKMYDLLRLVAFQIGSELSLDELGKQLGLSRNTVERYLDLLQKVYVLFKIGGFSKNLRKEVSKTSKWYFYDTGVRNAILRDFTPFLHRSDTERGGLWENYVISERIKRSFNHRLGGQFYFWRTYDKQEIDLIETDGKKIMAFEMKSGKRHSSAPAAFAKSYPEAEYRVVNRDNLIDFCMP